jgi:hypothetical protein
MAPIVPVPRIREENYKAFLALPTKNIPDTFNKWRDDQATEELHYIRNGWTIEPIEVNPEEFFRFCRRRDERDYSKDRPATLAVPEKFGSLANSIG